MRRPIKHWLEIGCGLLLALLVAVPVLALAALHTSAGRELLREQVLTALDGVIDGTLMVDEITQVSLSRVHLRGVHVIDRAGHEVASAQRVYAQVSLWPLLFNRIVIERAWLDGARVELGDLADGNGGLLGVIPKDDAADASEPTPAGATWTFHVNHLALTAANVTAQMEQTHLAIEGAHLRGDVHVDDEARIHVQRLRARVGRDDQHLAVIDGRELHYVTSNEARGTIKAWIGGSQVRVDGVLQAPDASGKQPLRATVHAHRVGPQVLALFDVDVDSWTRPLDLTAHATGDTTQLRYALRLFAPRGTLSASGTWQTTPSGATSSSGRGTDAEMKFDANVRAEGLDARSFSRESIAPVSASIRAQVQSTSDFEALSFAVNVSQASYGKRALPTLAARGAWSQAEGLRVSRLNAFDGSARLEGTFALDAQDNVSAQATLRADQLGAIDALTAVAPTLRGQLQLDVDAHFNLNTPLRARLNVHARGQALAFEQARLPYVDVRVVGGPEVFRAQANLREHGRVDIHARRVDGTMTLRGRGAARIPTALVGGTAPMEWISFALRDVRYQEQQRTWQVGELAVEHAGARIRVRGEHRRNRVTATLRAYVPDLKRIAAPWGASAVQGRVAFKADVSGSLERPNLTVVARYDTPELSVLRDVSVDSKVHAELSQLAIATHTQVRARFSGDDREVTAKLAGSFDRDRASLEASVADTQGPLMRAAVATALQGQAFPRTIQDVVALLNTRAWETHVWLGARRVDELPGIRSLGLNEALLPARVSTEATLAHAPGQEPEGKLMARAEFIQDEPIDEDNDDGAQQPASETCSDARRQTLALEATMHGGELAVVVRAHVGDREALNVDVKTAAPLNEWLTPVTPKPLTLAANVSDLRLADIPLVCERMEGTVSGAIKVERALAHDAEIQAQLKGAHMRVVHGSDNEPFDVYLFAKADRSTLLTRAVLRSDKGNALIRGKLAMNATSTLPMPDLDAPLELSAKLEQVSLPALLAAVPGVRARSGVVQGYVRVSGSIKQPSVQGDLWMKDATVLLPELGQPFERMTGRVLLRGNTLQLLKTRVHDRDGWADVTAELRWASMDKLHVEAQLRAKKLPIRRGGVILARFNGVANLTADMKPERTDVALGIRGASIVLEPEGSLSGTQALAEHPEIVFVDGAPGLLPAAVEAESHGELRVAIDAREPFWVRREDFSLLVSTHLNIAMQGESPSIEGAVVIERGFVELVGQSFDVERGRIGFAGGHDVEPSLDIVAQRRVSGGSLVTVEASGTLRAPELRFLVDGAPVSAGEAVAAAAGSRTNQSGAAVEQQMGAMASGLLAGVLTLGARRGFGEWVPVLAIESDHRQTRVRAGIEAHRLIPKFLRRIVVDAYVEGMLSAANSDDESTPDNTSGPQTQSAVLLELRFPHHLVGEAQYGPGSRWSADFSWEP